MIVITTNETQSTINEGRTMGTWGPEKQGDQVRIIQEPEGVDICHRDSAIRRLSITEGCDCGEAAGKAR